MHKHLMNIGFSEYEAKSYISLLANNPITAYEVAKLACIPTSKVYEVIGRLLEKGYIIEIEKDGKKKYVPMHPDDLVSAYKTKMDNTLSILQDRLNCISSEKDVSYIWNITDYDYLLEKGKKIIDEASNSLLVSIWPEEYRLLLPNLEKSIKGGVNAAIIYFGKAANPIGRLYEHPISDTIYSEKGGRGLVIVADSQEVLFGRIDDSMAVQGANSMNEGFVAMAEDYIKHDIYIMKIVSRFSPQLIETFGDNYYLLRDAFMDREIKKK